jgi:hypothetical protein
MWTWLASLWLASLGLFLAAGVAYAQSAEMGVQGRDSCFRAALAEAVCSRLSDAQQRDCLKEARALQRQCQQHMLSEMPHATPAPGSSSEPARSEPPPKLPEASSENASAEAAGRKESPEVSIESIRANEEARRLSDLPKSKEANTAPSADEAPTGAVRPNTSGKENDKPPREANWIVSETTSPVEYGPLITATIRSKSDARDGPNMLAVRCRAQHTEVMVRTDGAWNGRRSDAFQVDYQINDQPIVREQWMLSADGKTAFYRGDPVGLLRSIPDGATLKVGVAHKGMVRREAMFQLNGLDAVRQKVGALCKWAPVTARTSSEKQ